MKPLTEQHEHHVTPPAHREGYRIIQIHPTLNCNLKCRHCYSFSAPGVKTSLDPEALRFFLSSAYDMGYNTLAVSGGEPLLYPELKDLLAFTKSIGYFNSITSNGALLADPRKQEVLEFTDLVALSIDGIREEHNLIRNNESAFDWLLAATEVLRGVGARFGFIHLLHNEPLEVLSWLCHFSLEQGAGLLHLHPFERSGRGRMQQQLSMSTDQAYRFFILFHYLKQKHSQDFRMQLDLMHKDLLLRYPELVYCYEAEDKPATAFLKELIIDERGRILPVSHGFNPSYALGNISQKETAGALFKSYTRNRLKALIRLYRQTYASMISSRDTDLFNFAEWAVQASYSLPSDHDAPEGSAMADTTGGVQQQNAFH